MTNLQLKIFLLSILEYIKKSKNKKEIERYVNELIKAIDKKK